MQSSNNNDKQDREELNRIQRQKNEITNESLESTRRMVNLAAQSQELGNNTMIMLDEQGEKLNQTETRLDNINHDMKQAEKHLTNLEKWGGICTLPWRRIRHKHRPFKKDNTSHSCKQASPTTAESKLRMTGTEGMPTSGYITRITDGDDREEEMDDNLQILSSYIGNLKNTALDMNDTIKKQSEQTDRIANKTDAAMYRVDAAKERTQDQLRH